MTNNMDWVDTHEEKVKEERSKEYFTIEEGENRFVLLTHCAPLAQVWDQSQKKYRTAEEGDKNVSIKGVCWVLQDEIIKQAKLPYTVVKSIRALQQDKEWEFTLPFPHVLTLTAKGAGSKEVEYTLTPSPKKIEIPEEILNALKEKKTPEDIIETIKNSGTQVVPKQVEYPEDDIHPDDIPF